MPAINRGLNKLRNSLNGIIEDIAFTRSFVKNELFATVKALANYVEAQHAGELYMRKISGARLCRRAIQTPGLA